MLQAFLLEYAIWSLIFWVSMSQGNSVLVSILWLLSISVHAQEKVSVYISLFPILSLLWLKFDFL
uniref:Uncharacterized protein n=1 Tax=Rhizophora mucronata TaxID=61149 RepID=A0A2P2PPR0_RHIMU